MQLHFRAKCDIKKQAELVLQDIRRRFVFSNIYFYKVRCSAQKIASSIQSLKPIDISNDAVLKDVLANKATFLVLPSN